MFWCQVSLLVLSAATLLFSANQHGKPRDENENFWTTFATVLIQTVLLYFAGAYSLIFP